LSHIQKSIAGKIREEQFPQDFGQDHSTTLQLTKLIDKTSVNLNQGLQTAAVFLNVEKAFDSVQHDGQLHKMMTMCIPLELIKLTKSFLSDRTFSVKIDNQNSSVRTACEGVPQGSCLSPTLFNIYTNYIPTHPKAHVSLFADDTVFFSCNPNARFAAILSSVNFFWRPSGSKNGAFVSIKPKLLLSYSVALVLQTLSN